MTSRQITWTTLLTTALALGGCGDDGGTDGADDGTAGDGATSGGDDGGTAGDDGSDSGGDTGGDDGSGGEMRTLSWTFDGLAPLGDGFVYEGWIIVGGAPVSTGRFDVDEDGAPSLESFEVDAADADAAEKFVLTIEPEPDDDPGPAATKLLGGDFADLTAALSVADPAALGDDLTGAAGPFILETPSTGAVADDHALGIWWLDPSAGPGPSLMLPELPDGWVYEGWVVGDQGPVTTGRFSAVDAADDDGAGPTSGADEAPPFPGQDYIDPAMDLTGLVAVISVEPEPDDSAAPFLLKPLVDMDIEDVGAGVLQDMANNAEATNPSGTATFE